MRLDAGQTDEVAAKFLRVWLQKLEGVVAMYACPSAAFCWNDFGALVLVINDGRWQNHHTTTFVLCIILINFVVGFVINVVFILCLLLHHAFSFSADDLPSAIRVHVLFSAHV
jgi:hypothetical protein